MLYARPNNNGNTLEDFKAALEHYEAVDDSINRLIVT